MRSSEILKAARQRLLKCGVPEHVFFLEQDAPKIIIKVLIGGRLIELSVRQHATRAELDAKISEIEARWSEHKGVQTSIEQAIEAKS